MRPWPWAHFFSSQPAIESVATLNDCQNPTTCCGYGIPNSWPPYLNRALTREKKMPHPDSLSWSTAKRCPSDSDTTFRMLSFRAASISAPSSQAKETQTVQTPLVNRHTAAELALKCPIKLSKLTSDSYHCGNDQTWNPAAPGSHAASGVRLGSEIHAYHQCNKFGILCKVYATYYLCYISFAQATAATTQSNCSLQLYA